MLLLQPSMKTVKIYFKVEHNKTANQFIGNSVAVFLGFLSNKDLAATQNGIANDICPTLIGRLSDNTYYQLSHKKWI